MNGRDVGDARGEVFAAERPRRAVFLLTDVFGEPYDTVAAAVGKTDDNCRQIANRAPRKVREHRPAGVAPATEKTLGRMVRAVARGDIDELLALLDTDVTLTSDGGPHRAAARRPVEGAERVTRFLLNVGTRAAHMPVSIVAVNGTPALLVELRDGPVVLTADERAGHIVALRLLLTPDKLTHFDTPTQLR